MMRILIDIQTKVSSITSDLSDVRTSVKRLEDSQMGMKTDLVTVREGLANTDTRVTQLDETAQSQKAELQNLKISQGSIASRFEELEKKVGGLQDQVVAAEYQRRRENLIFDGIPLNVNRTTSAEDEVKGLLVNQLRLAEAANWRFKNCYRLNTNTRAGGIAPILCRFDSTSMRDRVWAAKSNLRDTAIRVKEDLPRDFNEKRRILYPFMLKAKQLGKRAHFVADKLMIEGTRYGADALEAIPNEFTLEEASCKQTENTFVFFGKSCPLSNFHSSPFTLNGQSFFCAEQYYQYMKCLHFHKEDKAHKVLAAKRPDVCKRIGDSVQAGPEWIVAARRHMQEGCMAKFSQNADCRDFLKSTNNKRIGEASRDATWGIGIPLRHARVTNELQWNGENYLGDILMYVRTRNMGLSRQINTDK